MSDKKKCADCKWLNTDKKHSIGYECESPVFHNRRGVAHIKPKSTPACKRGFEEKDKAD